MRSARSLWSQAVPWIIYASCRAERRRSIDAGSVQIFTSSLTRHGVVSVDTLWIGGSLEIGGTVRIQEFQPTIWCVTSTLAQEDLPRDLSILRTIANHHKGCFGAYANSFQTRIGACRRSRHPSERRDVCSRQRIVAESPSSGYVPLHSSLLIKSWARELRIAQKIERPCPRLLPVL